MKILEIVNDNSVRYIDEQFSPDSFAPLVKSIVDTKHPLGQSFYDKIVSEMNTELVKPSLSDADKIQIIRSYNTFRLYAKSQGLNVTSSDEDTFRGIYGGLG